MNKFDLVINHTMEIPEDKIIEFHNGLEKIKDNTPIQYITNHQEFMKLDFYVDENVLIPQPDTEILVEEVLKYVNQIDKTKSSKIKILDLCTGSGAIAVSLAKYIDNCEITATDISNKAIQIAKLNAKKNLVHSKINFIESNMFENLPKTQYDIIVSNPPYIETETILSLSPEVQKEPLLALDGGRDGLKFYKIILKNYTNYLNSNGKVFLEIGYNQKEMICSAIKQSNPQIEPICVKDLSGNDRLIIY